MTRKQFEEQLEAELRSLRGVIVEIDALLEDADRAEGITRSGPRRSQGRLQRDVTALIG